jgi:serine/threonine protein kinase
VHRDISAANILLLPSTATHDFKVKVIDFGLAGAVPTRQQVQASMQPALGGDAVFKKRAMQGTLLYLPPECTGQMSRMSDQRADIYSLGAVLYQMLTGELPLKRDKVDTTDGKELEGIDSFVQKILHQVPTPAHVLRPWVPVILSNIVAKCLQKNPDARYSTACGLLADLKRVQMNHEAMVAAEASGATVEEEPEDASPAPVATPATFSSFSVLGLTNFQLGQYDDASIFRISPKLYGREHHFEQLHACLNRMVTDGAAHVVSVRGAPGSGKTSLIHSIFQPLLQRQSMLFVSSKLEQYQRQPFAAIRQVVNALLLHVLTFPTSQLHSWKTVVLSVLHGNGSLLLPLFPALEQIIGAQPPAADLPAQETAARLIQLLVDFLCLFAQKERPLVCFFVRSHHSVHRSLLLTSLTQFMYCCSAILSFF